jgi:hypothetical protein
MVGAAASPPPTPLCIVTFFEYKETKRTYKQMYTPLPSLRYARIKFCFMSIYIRFSTILFIPDTLWCSIFSYQHLQELIYVFSLISRHFRQLSLLPQSHCIRLNVRDFIAHEKLDEENIILSLTTRLPISIKFLKLIDGRYARSKSLTHFQM